MRLVRLLLILIYTPLVFLSEAQNSSEKERNSIKETLSNYLIGTAEGKPELLRKAFHPDFKLYTVNEGALQIRSGKEYISQIKEGHKVNRIGRILSIDISDNVATAKVEVAIPDWKVFTDYFLLSKYQGEWKIIQKSYSSRTFTPSDQLGLNQTELDSLFAEVNRVDRPALAVLAIQEGKVVYQNAFGSTHLDHRLPATTSTKFQLAGLSKHFTAYGLLLLVDKGIISLSDDIRKYLPELPVYDHRISIEHLLSMSSGLPDIWALKEIGGWHTDDVFTRADAMNILSKVQPGFNPGESFIHSNTDIFLLSEIIARVVQQPFADYMDEQLFQPLNMRNTMVVDDFEEYVPNAAASYEPDGEGYKMSALNIGLAGATNVYSCIEDLAKWEMNLQNPTVGSKNMVKSLHAYSRTSDGETMDSMHGRFALAQQYYHWGHGVEEIYQIGTLGGYSSSIFKFPQQQFTVITLSSGIPYSGYLGMRLAEHFIGAHFDEEVIDFEKLETTKLSDRQLQKHVGNYWSQEAAFSRSIAVRDDTLRYVRNDGRESALLPLSTDSFQMLVGWNEKVIVSFSEIEGKTIMQFRSEDAPPILFQKTPKYEPTTEELSLLAGSYYCEALDIVYLVQPDKGGLKMENLRTGKIGLTAVKELLFEGDQRSFASIHFDKQRTGFHLRSEEVRGLWFEKM